VEKFAAEPAEQLSENTRIYAKELVYLLRKMREGVWKNSRQSLQINCRTCANTREGSSGSSANSFAYVCAFYLIYLRALPRIPPYIFAHILQLIRTFLRTFLRTFSPAHLREFLHRYWRIFSDSSENSFTLIFVFSSIYMRA
jgi:hypothetical protein